MEHDVAEKQIYRYFIELVTTEDMEEFANAVSEVESDVRICGKDENDNDWEVSGKSMLGLVWLASRDDLNKKRKKSGKSVLNDVDWNTLRCECSEDIYSRIQKWVKGSVLE